jgi:hypothetical protein
MKQPQAKKIQTRLNLADQVAYNATALDTNPLLHRGKFKGSSIPIVVRRCVLENRANESRLPVGWQLLEDVNRLLQQIGHTLHSTMGTLTQAHQRDAPSPYAASLATLGERATAAPEGCLAEPFQYVE